MIVFRSASGPDGGSAAGSAGGPVSGPPGGSGAITGVGTTRSGVAPNDGRFPAYRLVGYLTPAAFVFLFFPFRVLQWISILAILFILIACAVSYLIYRGVTVTSREPVIYAYRNDEIVIRLQVENNSRIPALNLGISVFTPSEIPGQQKIQGLMTLGAASSERFDATIRMSRRGEFPLSLVQVSGCDPFSLFPWQLSLRRLCTLVIYPSIHHGSIVPKRGVPGGAIRVQNRIYEDVNRIGSIRDYIPGDDIRRIHWKVSAKSGDLKTSQLLPAMDAPAVVILDMDSAVYSARYRYARIETGVEIAASLVHALGDMRQRVGLVSNGLDGGGYPVIPPVGHTGSSALALRVLARIAPSTDSPDAVSMFLDARFSMQAGMGCFIVTPRNPESLAPQLTHPTMVALRPTYYHLTDRRAAVSRGLPIDYVQIDTPEELFSHDS